eukprot:g24321.t1
MVTGSKVHLEVPKPPRPQVQQEPSSKMDFQALLELVGAKAAARFSSLQQCFRNDAWMQRLGGTNCSNAWGTTRAGQVGQAGNEQDFSTANLLSI